MATIGLLEDRIKATYRKASRFMKGSGASAIRVGNKLLDQFHKYAIYPIYVGIKYFWPLIILVLTIGLFVHLAHLYSSDNKQFWVEAPFTVGITAAVLAGVSASIALGSLRLSRASQRPFLTIVEEPQEPQVIGEKANPRVILHIENTGNLPADKVSVICGLRTAVNEEVTMALKHSPVDLEPSIYFPGVNVGHTFYMTKETFHELTRGEFSVVVNIKYDNKTARKKCSTVRTFLYDQLSKTPSSPKKAAHKEDWWD